MREQETSESELSRSKALLGEVKADIHGDWACPHAGCKYTERSYYWLERHFFMKHTSVPATHWRCGRCAASSSDKTELWTHIYTVHGLIGYSRGNGIYCCMLCNERGMMNRQEVIRHFEHECYVVFRDWVDNDNQVNVVDNEDNEEEAQ